jgi:lipid-A-disaccharide synthase
MKVALVAGESSGDLLGAGLINAIREREPDASFEGIAGPAMIAAGCTALAEAEQLAVMGFVEPLRRIPALLRLRRSLKKRWLASPPDVFVGIDAPDFNLALEAQLRAAHIPTAHYVSPSVWAWREGRVKKIRAAADTVLCVLPFEQDFYTRHGMQSVFVGHPTADRYPAIIDTNGARRKLGLAEDKPVLAVLPGSRGSEVSRLAPVFAQTCRNLLSEMPHLQFVIPAATPRLRTEIEAAYAAAGLADQVLITDGQSELVMSAADVVLLASGTAALESALLQKPTVAAYKLAIPTAVIIRGFRLMNVDKVTLPNQLTDEPLVPEFIQEAASAENLTGELLALFGDPSRRASIAASFAKLRSQLALDSDQRAAEAVLALSGHATS